MSTVTEKALSRYVLDLERQRDYWKRQAEKERKRSKADDYTEALLRATDLKVERDEARAEAEEEKKLRFDLERSINGRDRTNSELATKYSAALKEIERLTEQRNRARETLLMFVEELTPPGDDWQRSIVQRCKDGAAEEAP